MSKDVVPPDARFRLTPTGALAGAFLELVEESELGRAWWTKSALLAATGLAFHLDQAGWEVRRKRVRKAK